MKKRLLLIFAAFLAVLCSCTKEKQGNFINDDRILGGSISVEVGSVTLLNTPEVLSILWQSENENIAYVSGGYIFAQNLGVAKITAVCGKSRQSFNVVVTPVMLESFTIVDKNLTLYYGEEVELRVKDIMPEHATAASIDWKCSAGGIVDIKFRDGKVMVRGTGLGTTEVSASNGELTGNSVITVRDIDSFSISESSASLLSGGTLQLETTQSPKSIYKVKWTSSAPSVAKVDENGLVTAGTVSGNATVTAEAVGSKLPPVTCQVKVLGEDYGISVYSISAGTPVGKRVFMAPDEDFTATVKKLRFKVCMEDGSPLPESIVSQLKYEVKSAPAGFAFRNVDEMFNIVRTSDKFFFSDYVTVKVTAPNGSSTSFEYCGYPKDVSVLVPKSGTMSYQMISDLQAGLSGSLDMFKYVTTSNIGTGLTVSALDIEKGFVIGMNWSYSTTCCSTLVSSSSTTFKVNEFTRNGDSVMVGHAYKSGVTGTHLDYLKPSKPSSVYITGKTDFVLAGQVTVSVVVR